MHLALACGALLAPGVGEQVLISALVDQIRADAAEQAITVTDSISDRRQVVRALRLLESWGVVAETDGSLSAWGERAEDEALLSINRSLLIHLLPSPLHHFETAEDTWSRLAPEPPRRRLRQRLVENPALAAQARQLTDELAEIVHTLTAIKSREIFKTADDLVQRDNAEAALATAADQALAGLAGLPLAGRSQRDSSAC